MNTVASEAPQTGSISLFEKIKRLGYSFKSKELNFDNTLWLIRHGGTTAVSGKF